MQRCFGGVRCGFEGPSLKNVFRLDMNALPFVQACAERGLQVDLSHFAALDVGLTRDMEQITEDVKSLTGYYVNIDSGDQVADLLFNKMGMKQAKVKMVASGERESVEDEVLTAIQHEHPVISMLQDFKELSKLRGTYVRPMPKLATRTKFGEWRMYPNFKTTRVPSGRLAASDPNLLAMPSRTNRGLEIRKGFITDSGWSYVSVDFSQIEVRMAAHSSQDPNLMRVYENEEDIYSDFATTAFKLKDERYRSDSGEWKYPTVNKLEHRYPSKTCVLAAIYDVTAMGLQEQMPVICANCDKPAICPDCVKHKVHDKCNKHDCRKFSSKWVEDPCQRILNAFYMRYPGVMTDRKRAHRISRTREYIFDMWGRILHVAAVKSVHEWAQMAALREAGNFVYQCLSGASLVWSRQGLVPLLSLENKGLIDLWDGKEWSTGTVAATGAKSTLQIELYVGLCLQCSPDHCILVHTDSGDKWIRACDLREQDNVICQLWQTSPITRSRVKSITALPKQEMYDFVNSTTGRFLAEGMVVHNSGAQGIIKVAMAEVFDLWADCLHDFCYPLLQIHDELLFECRTDMAQELGEIIKDVFEHCVRLRVPVKANWCTAESWGALPK